MNEWDLGLQMFLGAFLWGVILAALLAFFNAR